MASPRIFCLGASAGGLSPVMEIVSHLPKNFPGAVFVLIHMSAESPSQLPGILDRASEIRCAAAIDGEEILPERVYVAVPDHHLLIEDGHVRVLRGPKENRHRPSIDVLFRSAARFYGPAVTGVVLSGALDDGTAGLIAIKVRGGTAIVQDPTEAFSSEMPRNAMRYLEVDRVASAKDIAPALLKIARTSVPESEPPVPPEMVDENRIAKADFQELSAKDEDHPGNSSPFACPDCHGVLWEIEEGRLVRYRCRVGHAYSPETLMAAGDESVEEALWEGLRAIEERVSLRRRLAGQARERRLDALAQHFERQIPDAVRHAKALRDMLVNGSSQQEPPRSE